VQIFPSAAAVDTSAAAVDTSAAAVDTSAAAVDTSAAAVDTSAAAGVSARINTENYKISKKSVGKGTKIKKKKKKIVTFYCPV
jgi:hypothetical protein